MAQPPFDFELLVRGGFPLQRFETNAKIFVQDDPGECMYVVRSGKVGILAGGAVLENIGPNGTFGEMALIDGALRSATAVAREPTEVAFDGYKTLLEVLREDLGLCGTKHGCELGECGACAVILDGQPVLSCLVLGVECDGREVVTVEGLATDGRLHPLQETFADLGAAQCGYCTPGFLITAKALRLIAYGGALQDDPAQAAVARLWQIAHWPRVQRLLD